MRINESSKWLKSQNKLSGMYHPDALKKSEIMKYIHHILGRNGTVSTEIENEMLDNEFRQLGLDLRDKPLTPKQRETIETRREDICRTLYPEYHPPTP